MISEPGRLKTAACQGAVFVDYPYHEFITIRPVAAVKAAARHNQHANRPSPNLGTARWPTCRAGGSSSTHLTSLRSRRVQHLLRPRSARPQLGRPESWVHSHCRVGQTRVQRASPRAPPATAMALAAGLEVRIGKRDRSLTADVGAESSTPEIWATLEFPLTSSVVHIMGDRELP